VQQAQLTVEPGDDGVLDHGGGRIGAVVRRRVGVEAGQTKAAAE
jgi:hypothetical protein